MESFKIFSSRSTGPILTRLGTNHPWVKGIQLCSKEEDSPSPRGDNSRRVKIHLKIFKIFFSRTSRPNLIKLGTYYPCVKGIQICSNKGPGPLLRGDNYKSKIGVVSFKNLLLQNHWANFKQTLHRSFLGRGVTSVFKRRRSPFSKGR